MSRVTSDFTTSNERILQWVTSDFTTSNEQRPILQRATSGFLQRAASATSNERILQRVTSDFTTSNEQRVKSYASLQLYFKALKILDKICLHS